MRRLLLAAALAVPFFAAAPSYAAPILISAPSSNTVNLAGTVGGTALSATAALNVVSFTASQIVINVSLTNSVAAATPGQNRLVSFGFDLTPDDHRTLTTGTGSNGWDVSVNNVNITGGTRVDVCAWDGNNCTGGANQGVGETLTEIFTLTLKGSFLAPLSMDNFVARYQSIGSTGTSGLIFQTTPPSNVPEPISLAILGTGLIGLAAARRLAR